MIVTTSAPTQIRPLAEADIQSVTAIYAREVLEGVATFELDPPGAVEMTGRIDSLVQAGYPWLVADCDGAIAGYAYAGPFRARPAFRHTVENSIYLAPQFQRRGIGRLLLEHLIAECEARDFRQMISVIGGSENVASARLHERCGFTHAGVWESTGWKFGRWIDCVVLQRPLGPGDSEPARAG
ncbi:MAG: N-acetyltransferase [Hyphomicrobiales bacterium]|nr:N-acetyltransferase [Hyphomicrobiales bacterium]